MQRCVTHALAVLLCLASCATIHAGSDRTVRLRELGRAVAEAERLAQQNDPLAEARFRVALDAAEPLGKTVLLARALDGLAETCLAAGRLEEAATLYTRAIPLWEELLGRKQPRLAVSLFNLGALRLEQEDPGRALPYLKRALEIWETTLGPDSPQAANARRAVEMIHRGEVVK